MGMVEHRAKYASMAKVRGVAITKLSLFGLLGMHDLKSRFADDEHLNNIPLRYFDNLTQANHPWVSLSEGCCMYKELLIQLIEAEAD